jgi:hypothetical protein
VRVYTACGHSDAPHVRSLFINEVVKACTIAATILAASFRALNTMQEEQIRQVLYAAYSSQIVARTSQPGDEADCLTYETEREWGAGVDSAGGQILMQRRVLVKIFCRRYPCRLHLSVNLSHVPPEIFGPQKSCRAVGALLLSR